MKNVENIDWNLYKGKETDKGKKTYMKFISCFNDNGWKLVSDYIDSSSPVDIECENCHKVINVKLSPFSYRSNKLCKYRKINEQEDDLDIELDLDNSKLFEIDDSLSFPKGYNTVLGIPQKSVNLKEELRRSRLLGQISRTDDILEFSKIEKNN